MKRDTYLPISILIEHPFKCYWNHPPTMRIALWFLQICDRLSILKARKDPQLKIRHIPSLCPHKLVLAIIIMEVVEVAIVAQQLQAVNDHHIVQHTTLARAIQIHVPRKNAARINLPLQFQLLMVTYQGYLLMLELSQSNYLG